MNKRVYYSTWEEVLKHLTGEQPFPPPDQEERLFVESDDEEEFS